MQFSLLWLSFFSRHYSNASYSSCKSQCLADAEQDLMPNAFLLFQVKRRPMPMALCAFWWLWTHQQDVWDAPPL